MGDTERKTNRYPGTRQANFSLSPNSARKQRRSNRSFGKDPKTGLVKIKGAGSSKVLRIVSTGLVPSGLSSAYASDYILPLLDTLLARIAEDKFNPDSAVGYENFRSPTK